MRTRDGLALCLLLLACGGSDSTHPAATEKPDSGRRASQRDQPDSGEPAVCRDHENSAAIELNGETVAVTRTTQVNGWGGVDGKEAFFLILTAGHDVFSDDGFQLVINAYLAPSAVEAGGEFSFDQQVEVEAGGRGKNYLGLGYVHVTSAPGQSPEVEQVLVQGRKGSQDAASYHVRGKLMLAVDGNRLSGSITLALEGSIPLRVQETSETLAMTSCFEFEVDNDGHCIPGAHCGNDCYGPEDGPCGACGELRYTVDCHCRPQFPPIPACQNPEPAGEGELCGTYWWCDRACAEGLSCKEDPSYNTSGDMDGGAGNDNAAGCTYFTCQR